MISKSDDNWIETYTGKQFWPLDPEPASVDIEDIAHALATTNRFNGHATEPYSVAQHSVLCCDMASPPAKAQALLHDATEAYLPDLTRPVKTVMPEFRSAEDNLWRTAIAPRFGLPPTFVLEVQEVDVRMLVTEARDLALYRTFAWWRGRVDPYSITIEPWSWRTAEARFLERFHALRKAGLMNS